MLGVAYPFNLLHLSVARLVSHFKPAPHSPAAQLSSYFRAAKLKRILLFWYCKQYVKVNGCYSNLTFMFCIIANDCACGMNYHPRMHHKQIEIWGITSTSGNFRPYQIQIAFIHFNVERCIHS